MTLGRIMTYTAVFFYYYNFLVNLIKIIIKIIWLDLFERSGFKPSSLTASLILWPQTCWIVYLLRGRRVGRVEGNMSHSGAVVSAVALDCVRTVT